MNQVHSLVSVIIPCYNQAQYLSEALQSVLDQTYENWECIIVNDGSPDNTEEVALEWCQKDKRFRYLKKENGGLSSARNAGLKIAKGDYIQLLDSDDLIALSKLKYQVLFLNENSIIDIAYVGSRYFETENQAVKLVFGRNNFYPFIDLSSYDTNLIDIIKIKNPFVISSPLFRKSVFDHVGFYDEELHALEDWDFQIRCVKMGLVFQYLGYHPSYATFIRLHRNSMMRNDNWMQSAFLKLKRKHKDIFDHNSNKEIDWLCRIKAFLKLIIPPVFILIYNYFSKQFIMKSK